MQRLYQGDCLEVLKGLPECDCIIADPPDNLGLKYDKFKDCRKDYVPWLRDCLYAFTVKAPVVWISFNAKWTFAMGKIVADLLAESGVFLEAKPCVQTYTFGQHNHHDLGNNHRPLWRIMWKGTELYPEQIRVPSWRQENGDKRADPRGRVPGDVFDFTRVVGNSKQRRRWHPTQLHEGLVERCVLMSTKEGGTVLDPFGGTGTTMRVCRRLKRNCMLIEYSDGYCEQIAAENNLKRRKDFWSC